MATRLYGVSAGETGGTQVTEGAGSAVAADTVELTVDLATTTVNTGATTRAISKAEVLEAIDKITAQIVSGNWPPA